MPVQPALNQATLVLVDGAEGAVFDPLDRGLMYGDGVFRTLLVTRGQPRWWDEHLEKLAGDCARLGIPTVADALWQADLASLAGRMEEGVLKLVVTRGSGPRGYLPPDPCQPRRLFCYSEGAAIKGPVPAATVRVCRLRLGHQPALAGIKHLNRLEQVLARAEWHDPTIHEGLLLDQAGRVISGVMSNIFLWRDGELITPSLTQCGVAGVARARLMSLAGAKGYRVREAEFGLDDVFGAQETMLTNSVSGLRRIGRLEEKSWPDPVVSGELGALLDA